MNEDPSIAQKPKSFLDTKYGELTFRENLDHIDHVLGGFEGKAEIDASGGEATQGNLDLSFLVWASKLLEQIRGGVEGDSSIQQEEKDQVTQRREVLIRRIGGVLGKVKLR